MKKQFSVSAFFILFAFLKVNAQNEIYIISEKYDGIIQSVPTFDSVFVTSPTGVTTKHKIPSYITNPGGHDSQYNIILNSVTSLGYRVITPAEKEGVSNPALAQPYCIIRTIYLSKP